MKMLGIITLIMVAMITFSWTIESTSDIIEYEAKESCEGKLEMAIQENEMLLSKLNQAIIYLEEYANATPENINILNGRVMFTIHDIHYSIGLPDPKNPYLENITIALSVFSPSFANISNFDFQDSRFKLTLGYELFGFRLYSQYDFVNQWQFAIDFNVIKLLDLL